MCSAHEVTNELTNEVTTKVTITGATLWYEGFKEIGPNLNLVHLNRVHLSEALKVVLYCAKGQAKGLSVVQRKT